MQVLTRWKIKDYYGDDEKENEDDATYEARRR